MVNAKTFSAARNRPQRRGATMIARFLCALGWHKPVASWRGRRVNVGRKVCKRCGEPIYTRWERKHG